jgi:hypothetical protein
MKANKPSIELKIIYRKKNMEIEYTITYIHDTV